MGSLRIVTVESFLQQVNFELRNIAKVQYIETEIISYLNKWLEFINQNLIESESELVRTGLGALNTVIGQEKYKLDDFDIGDLVAPYKVWIAGKGIMEQVTEDDRYPYVQANEEAINSANDIPIKYYIENDIIGLLPFPDDVYPINIKYYPDFTPMIDNTSILPYRNLFNLQLQEGIKIIAKNREMSSSVIDSALMELFRDRIISILSMRERHQVKLSPVFE